MDAREVVITSASGKATQAGAFTMIGAWFAHQDTLGLVGMGVGLAGLLVNWYYKAKDDRRKQMEFDKEMAGK